MEYKINDTIFSLSYQELKNKHDEICSKSLDEFMDNLPEALHLACIIAWLKELPTYNVLNDHGIIHQLAHLMHIPDEALINKQEIFEQYKKDLKLC